MKMSYCSYNTIMTMWLIIWLKITFSFQIEQENNKSVHIEMPERKCISKLKAKTKSND